MHFISAICSAFSGVMHHMSALMSFISHRRLVKGADLLSKWCAVLGLPVVVRVTCRRGMHLLLVVLILLVLMAVLLVLLWVAARRVWMMVRAVWAAHLYVLIVHARYFFFTELNWSLVFEISDWLVVIVTWMASHGRRGAHVRVVRLHFVSWAILTMWHHLAVIILMMRVRISTTWNHSLFVGDKRIQLSVFALHNLSHCLIQEVLSGVLTTLIVASCS